MSHLIHQRTRVIPGVVENTVCKRVDSVDNGWPSHDGSWGRRPKCQLEKVSVPVAPGIVEHRDAVICRPQVSCGPSGCGPAGPLGHRGEVISEVVDTIERHVSLAPGVVSSIRCYSCRDRGCNECRSDHHHRQDVGHVERISNRFIPSRARADSAVFAPHYDPHPYHKKEQRRRASAAFYGPSSSEVYVVDPTTYNGSGFGYDPRELMYEGVVATPVLSTSSSVTVLGGCPSAVSFVEDGNLPQRYHAGNTRCSTVVAPIDYRYGGGCGSSVSEVRREVVESSPNGEVVHTETFCRDGCRDFYAETKQQWQENKKRYLSGWKCADQVEIFHHSNNSNNNNSEVTATAPVNNNKDVVVNYGIDKDPRFSLVKIERKDGSIEHYQKVQ